MGVITAWAAAVALQTAYDVRVEHRAPVPSEFVASGVVFSGLGILGSALPGPAGLIAWGLLIMLGLRMYQGGGVPTVFTATPKTTTSRAA